MQELTFPSKEEELFAIGSFDNPSGSGVLFLSGGANIPLKESFYPDLQQQLQENGINSLSFDYRGVGSSSIPLEQTGLMTRVEDAKAAIKVLRSKVQGKLVVVGLSMGGSTAIQLSAELGNINCLVLIYPAAYSKNARTKEFGELFKAEITRPNSWQTAPEFEELQRYKGELLLAYGAKDTVVPQPILSRYAEIVRSKGGRVLAFPNAEHSFMRNDDPESSQAADLVMNSIISLSTN